MRILIIGGTRFVGRHIAAAAMERDHQVTLFHRGRTGPDVLPQAEHLLGDRDASEALAALALREWDATIDTCGYVPRQVRALGAALGTGSGRYVFISSVSVYRPPASPGYTEDAPLIEFADPAVEDVTAETYGGLKVLCERAALDAFGTDVLTIRPTYVVGPHDHTWRFPRWVRRIADGGEVLAPGPAEDPAQVIDARDMAAWIVHLVERELEGTFHAASPPPPFSWGQLLDVLVEAVGPPGTALTWVDGDFLRGEGLGQRDLPLWTGGDADRFMSAADPGAAYVTGLSPRPLEDTAHDTLDWIRNQPAADGERPGLDPAREADLLARWRAHSAARPR